MRQPLEPVANMHVNRPEVKPQRWATAMHRLLNLDNLVPGAVPDDVIRDARIEHDKVAGKNYWNLPYKVLLYLTPTLSDVDGFDDYLWNRHDRKISRLLNSGRVSKLIWTSFAKLQPEIQAGYLARNPQLRVYQQFHELLNTPSANKPYQLLKFIGNNKAFVLNQLKFDHQLREQFFYTLSGSYLRDFKPLLHFITQHRELAHDFEVIFKRIINGSQPAGLNDTQPLDPAKDIILQKYLVGGLINGNVLSDIILKNPQHFSDAFIAEIILRSGPNRIAEYRANFNSLAWKAGNFFKSLFPHKLSKLFFDVPPLKSGVHDIIKSIIDQIPVNPNPAKKAAFVKKSSYDSQIKLAPFIKPRPALAENRSVDLTVIHPEPASQPPEQSGMIEDPFENLLFSPVRTPTRKGYFSFASSPNDAMNRQSPPSARQAAAQAKSVDLTNVDELSLTPLKPSKAAVAKSVDLTNVDELRLSPAKPGKAAMAKSVDLTNVDELRLSPAKPCKAAMAKSVDLTNVDELLPSPPKPSKAVASKSVDLTEDDQLLPSPAKLSNTGVSKSLDLTPGDELLPSSPKPSKAAVSKSVDLTIVDEESLSYPKSSLATQNHSFNFNMRQANLTGDQRSFIGEDEGDDLGQDHTSPGQNFSPISRH
jgi:hypothetical protein